jgi:hypothetical protein
MRAIAGSIENLSQNGNTLRTPTLVEKMMIYCGFGVYGFGDNTISKIGNVLHNLTSLSRVTEVFLMVFFFDIQIYNIQRKGGNDANTPRVLGNVFAKFET